MTVDEKKRELALYRLKQAKEALDEASYLSEGKKSPRSVINRTYYAMFYSVLALLVFEEFSTSKHSGVISYFNKRFIKGGILPQELGKDIVSAFDLRLLGDYREYSELSDTEVKSYIPKAGEFINQITAYLKKKRLI